MQTNDQIKELVRSKYAEIAGQSKAVNESSCCGAGGCSTEVYNIMNDDYSTMEGYNPDADLGLGCGLPTEFAGIKPGDTVVDLGSGAGNDCFVARAEAGENGKVIGIDFTEEMIAKARENADKLGFNNVEFRQGDIENIPMVANRADVVVSNCVLNLVPDKQRAFSEIYRILKPDGHFSISDVVLEGQLAPGLQHAAEMYAGCVAGAMQKADYMAIIRELGFTNVRIQKEKEIIIPDDILTEYLSHEDIAAWKQGGTKIQSITVFAEKPACEPGGGCC